MSTRAQRFGPQIGGYRSRSRLNLVETIATAVRTPTDIPTAADLAATVYAQIWEHRNDEGAKVSRLIHVLALGPAQAVQFGTWRLEAAGVDHTRWQIATNRESIAYRWTDVLREETPDEWSERQASYERRTR